MHYLDDFKNYLDRDIYYIYMPLFTEFDNLPTDKFILVNCASEHYGNENYIIDLYDKLVKMKVNFLITSHLPNHHLSKSNLIHYPYWYHWTINFFTKTYKINLHSNIKKY